MTDLAFTSIVVGIDGRAGGADALALAGALARGGDVRLTLGCAYLDPIGTRLVPGEVAGLRERALAYLAAARTKLSDVECEVRPIATSSPARGLHHLAEEVEADLIVVGSSHRGGLGRVLPGSVTQQVLHGSPCAVAVAPAGLAERETVALRRVGCAYDGESASQAALEVAKRLVRGLDGALEIVDVLAPPTIFPAYPGVPALPEPWEDVEHAVRVELDEAIASVGELSAVAVMPTGDPAAQLVLRSETLDLLVMGSRGYGPVRRVLLGTVAGQVVRDARCPVIVVPRGIDVETPADRLPTPEITAA